MSTLKSATIAITIAISTLSGLTSLSYASGALPQTHKSKPQKSKKKNSKKNNKKNKFEQMQKFLDKLPFKINGRIIVDSANYFPDKQSISDGVEIRSARLGIKGKVTQNWGYNFSADFRRNGTELKDAAILYSGFTRSNIRIGYFKQPFSLNEMTSSKYITFMERGLVNALVPSRRIGVGAQHHGNITSNNYYTWAFSAYGKNATATDSTNQGNGFAARITDSLAPAKDRIIMLGINGNFQQAAGNHQIDIAEDPESDVSNVDFVDTGIIMNVHSQYLYDIESAMVFHQLSLQGEFISKTVTRNMGLPNLHFNGWYAFASWFLTGEHRNFKTDAAKFGRIKPLHHYGAFELAVRYSALNLNSQLIQGGYEHNITAGLNWYANKYVRFMLNYIKVYSKKAGINDNPNIVQVRAQINF